MKTLQLLAVGLLLLTSAGVQAQPAPLSAPPAQQPKATAPPAEPVDLKEVLSRIDMQWREISPKLTRNHLIYQRLAARSWHVEFKTLGTSDALSLNCKPLFSGLPKMSQDGKTFYFQLMHPSLQVRHLIALERFQKPRVLTTLPIAAAYYEVSPDEKEVIFQQRVGSSGYKIFRKTNLQSEEAVEVTDPKVGGLFPSYSPDGSTLAYMSQRKLRLRNVATGEERVVVDDPLLKELPTWSPDGQEIAYQAFSDESCQYDIYKVEVGTNHKTRLTASIGLDVNPVFTADGQSILFTSDRVHGTNRPTICIMGRNGENVQFDASAGRPIYLPSVSKTAVLIRGAHMKNAPDRKIAAKASPTPAPTPGAGPAQPPVPAPQPAIVQQNTVAYTHADLLEDLASRKALIEQALDGQHLFFLARETTGVQLLAAKAGSGGPLLLAELPHSSLAAPDVGPDRSTVVFKFVDQAARNTHLVKLERGKPATDLLALPLTPDLAFDSFDVSESGSFVVFDVRVEEGSTIFHHDIATGKTRSLLAPEEGGFHPDLSPGDEKVAYLSGGAIRVMDLAVPGSAPTLLAQDSTLKQFPAWFGTSSICYQGSTGEVGGFDLYLAQTTPGTPPLRLTKSAGDDMMPAIHGPSGQVFFVSDRENAGYPELFSMGPDGSGQQRYDAAGADIHFPR